MFGKYLCVKINSMLVHLKDICAQYDFCNLTNTGLIWCVACGFLTYTELVVKVFKKTLNIFKTGSVMDRICTAIEENNTYEAIVLLKDNPNYINKARNDDGYTPFLIACANCNTQLVKYMLSKGADVRKKSASGESAFYLASFYYICNRHEMNATCIRELFYAGADINEPNEKGMSPLQMAAMFGHSPLVKWLLVKRASLSVVPHPYKIASSQGYRDTAVHIKNWENHNSPLAINYSQLNLNLNLI